MRRSHAAILDDKSDRGLRRVKKCSREEDGNVKFVVGEGVGKENGRLALGSRFSR